MIEKPWIAGPKELLVHGLQHLDLNSDFDNRIAMISIDNSVELMIKTYLGLPKRISKIEGITRKKFEEMTSNFPNLLDGLEEFGNGKLNGIDLGDIEWFHRVRNQLYHDGNGITVEKKKVEAYAEIAKILFENLFELRIEETGNEVLHYSLVGEFIKLWADLERQAIHKDEKPRSPIYMLREMLKDGTFSKKQAEKFDNIRQFRNNLVHGMSSPSESELKIFVKELKDITDELKKND
ncbi:hypothetical protein DENIS_2773 [Desulfonema ishimotonii]|uniref:Apea-like HEPN domain-containing protein n=1 Tax=Desulfonema ishimotonii TaxID=45657 RepID=A0A401FXW5_9BACT|nr:hypothetical protein [Desulfonema ishimotonii]GBC61811.1 hypothetical protein DENIS_2773 [Desulfonema ishimotonii]